MPVLKGRAAIVKRWRSKFGSNTPAIFRWVSFPTYLMRLWYANLNIDRFVHCPSPQIWFVPLCISCWTRSEMTAGNSTRFALRGAARRSIALRGKREP